MKLEFFKKHPYLSGVAGLVGLILMFVLLRKGGGSSSSAGSGQTYDSSQLSMAQLDAASSIQQGQQATQLAIAQTQAGIQNNAIAAQLAETTAATQAQTAQTATQVAAQVQALQITSDAQTQQKANDDQVFMHQLDAQNAVFLSSIDAGVKENQTNNDTAVSIATLEAGLDSQSMANQQQIAASVIAGASADKGRSSTGWTQIISSLEGQGPAAIAANQPSATANSAGAVLGGVSKIVSGLFA